MEIVTTIDLTPTPEGFAAISERFKRSIEQTEADVKKVEQLIEDGCRDTSWGTDTCQLIEQALTCLLAEKDETLTQMRKAVAEIDAYLASLESCPFDA